MCELTKADYARHDALCNLRGLHNEHVHALGRHRVRFARAAAVVMAEIGGEVERKWHYAGRNYLPVEAYERFAALAAGLVDPARTLPPRSDSLTFRAND